MSGVRFLVLLRCISSAVYALHTRWPQRAPCARCSGTVPAGRSAPCARCSGTVPAAPRAARCASGSSSFCTAHWASPHDCHCFPHRPLDDAAADTLSAGANEPKSERGLLGHAAAGAPSAGATKLEGKRGLLDHAAAGAPPTGAIIVTDSVKSVADCFPGVKRVAGGGYEISSDEILFADDTQSNTTTAAPADVSPLREINTEDDVAGAEGEAIENIEVQPGLASDAPGYGGADEDDSPSRGGVDASTRPDSRSTATTRANEEPAADLKGYISRRVIISCDLYYGGPPGVVYAWAHRGANVYEHHVNYDDTRRWHALGNYGAGRPRGDAAAGALSTGAINIESTGRPLDDAAAGALSAGAIKIESKRDPLGHAAVSALSAGAIIKLESTGRPPDDAAAHTLSVSANELESNEQVRPARPRGRRRALDGPPARRRGHRWRSPGPGSCSRLSMAKPTPAPSGTARSMTSSSRPNPSAWVDVALEAEDRARRRSGHLRAVRRRRAPLQRPDARGARARRARAEPAQGAQERFEIKFGETNPEEDYFLGANRVSHGLHATTIRCDTHIGSIVERYLPGVDAYSSSKRFPGSYGDTPAGVDLTANYEAAVTLRP